MVTIRNWIHYGRPRIYTLSSSPTDRETLNKFTKNWLLDWKHKLRHFHIVKGKPVKRLGWFLLLQGINSLEVMDNRVTRNQRYLRKLSYRALKSVHTRDWHSCKRVKQMVSENLHLFGKETSTVWCKDQIETI